MWRGFKKNMNKKEKYQFGVISDTQERKGENLEGALKPLRDEENKVDLDFIVQLGDLAGTGVMTQYAKVD